MGEIKSINLKDNDQNKSQKVIKEAFPRELMNIVNNNIGSQTATAGFHN